MKEKQLKSLCLVVTCRIRLDFLGTQASNFQEDTRQIKAILMCGRIWVFENCMASACQQNQRQERLIWTDKSTELQTTAGYELGWIYSLAKLNQGIVPYVLDTFIICRSLCCTAINNRRTQCE